MTPSPFLPQAALAQLLTVSKRTLERWRVEGTGPTYVKAGRRVLYRYDDVVSWLSHTSRRSTCEAGATDA
jgi:predicted site-specific integrase-resolvase